MRLAPFVAALMLVGCASAGAVRVVEGPGFVLRSPFDEPSTAEWRDLVARETTAVEAFLGAPPFDPPAIVTLEPIDVSPDGDLLAQLDPRDHGRGGWATSDGTIHLIVGREAGGLTSASNRSKLRHELAHLFLHRLGIDGPRWFHEGFAHELEDCVDAAGGLAFHPAPARLAFAAALLDTDLQDEGAFRARASACVRFLVERVGAGWRGRLPELAATEKDSAADSWLKNLDFAGLVARGAADPDPAIRAAAASGLVELAEWAQRGDPRAPSIRGAVSRRTDDVALRIVADPACWFSAASYLVWFRARDLTAADVAGLADEARSPSVRLAGLAVRSRRGEAVDERLVASLLDRLGGLDRLRATTLLGAATSAAGH